MYLKILHGDHTFFIHSRRVDNILTGDACKSPRANLLLSIKVILLGLLMLMGTPAAQAQLFEQDFSSGTSLSTYMGSPVTNQKFDTIYASGGAAASVTTAGYTKLNLDLNAGGNAGFVRNTNFSVIPNDIMYQFDLDVTHSSSPMSSVAFWEVGNNFSMASSQSQNAHSRIFLNLDASGQFSLSYLNPMMSMFLSTSSFSGKQHITWVINNGTATKSYRAPDGSIDTVGADMEDVWIGTTKAFDELSAISPINILADFNFHASTSNAIFDFSNILIDPIPDIPTSQAPTNITSGGFTANWLSVTGCNGYRVDVSADTSFNILIPGYSNVLVNGQASNQLSVTGLNALTSYYYRVRAVSTYSFSEIAGGHSATQIGTTLCSAPSTPGGFIQVGSFNACGSTQLAYPVGIPPIRYYWQNQLNGISTSSASDGLPNFTVSSSGTYYIRGLDTSTQCWSVNSLSTGPIVIHPLPVLVSMQGGGVSLCSDPTATTPITLTASSGTPPYTFFYTVNNGVTQSISTLGSNGSVTVNVPLNIPGVFTYQLNGISDSNGCYTGVVSTAALVTINPSVTTGTISISETSGNVKNDGIICNGSSVTLTATGGTSYNWSSSSSSSLSTSSTLTQSPTATTTYSVTISNINGSCSQVVSNTITVNSLPTASIFGDTTVCLNSSSPAIRFIGSNTIAPYQFTYNIDNGANQLSNTTGTDTATVFASTVSVGSSAYYLISVKDALGCIQLIQDTATVTIPAQPIGQFDGPATETFCSSPIGTTTVLLSSASLFPPFTYSYNVNGNTVTLPSGVSSIPLSLATSGTNVYNLVSVSNSLGCINYSTPSTKTVNVTSSLIISISAQDHTGLSLTDGIVCEGDSITLTASGGSTYTWNTGATTQSIVVPYDSINQNNSRIYSVTSLSVNGTCTGTNSITVGRKSAPSASITGSTVLCSDPLATTPIILKGSNGILPYTFRYTLNNGPTQQITTTGLSDSVVLLIPINISGTYTYALVSVKDSNGCDKTATGSAVITVNPSVITGAISVLETSGNVNNDGIICNGSLVTLTATGGTSYNWSSSSSSSLSTSSILTQSPIATTTYSVTISNINGSCSQVVSNTITVNSLPTASIFGDTTVCLNSSSPAIRFIGSNTIAPYQFTYNIGNGANQLANTTGTDTATVFASTVSVGSSGYHLISVKDAFGCIQLIQDTAIVTIPAQPIGQFDGPATETFCSSPIGTTTVLLSSASLFPPFTYSYNVNGNTVTLPSGVSSIPLSLATSGTNVYNLVSVSNSLGCINYSTPSTKTVNVTSSLIISISAQDHTGLSLTDGIICEGDSITLTASGGSTYTWNTGATTQSIVIPYDSINQNNSRIYTVTSLSGNGICTGTNSITVGRKPAPSASMVGTTTLCSDPTQTTPIIMKGSNGVLPYTFRYNLNNGPIQQITTTGLSDSVILHVPINVTGSYTYNLKSIEDSLSCEKSLSDSVVVIVKPSITQGALQITESSGNVEDDANICIGDLVTLTASGGSSYNWSSIGSPSLSTNNVLMSTPLTTTVYSVTIYNADASCSQVLSLNVNVNTLPLASIYGTDTVCQFATSPPITLVGSNTINPYKFTYTVDNGLHQVVTTSSGNDTAIVFAPTFNVVTSTYKLISVSDALGCTKSISGNAVITIPTQPTAKFVDLDTAVYCTSSGSQSIQISSNSAFSPFTFNYSFAGSNNALTNILDTASISFSLANSGTYVYNLISVENSLGCINYNVPSTKTVKITPAFTVGIEALDQTGLSLTDGIMCEFDSLKLTAVNGGGKYLWSNGSTTQSITIPASSIVPGTSQSFSVTSYSTDSICSSTATRTITRKSSPVATISGGTVLCSNPQATTGITFTGSNGVEPYAFTYTLNNGASQQILTASTSNLITIPSPLNTPGSFAYNLQTVRDNNGCEQSVGLSDTVFVDPSVTQSIIAAVDTSGNVSNDGIICTGATVLLKANTSNIIGGHLFSWSNSSTDSSILINPTTTTNYTVTITNSKGTCGQTVTRAIIVNNNPLLGGGITSPVSLCKGDTASITIPIINGLTPYQFEYYIGTHSSPLQVVFSNTSVISIPVNTLTDTIIADTIIYHLISVNDNNGCELNLDTALYHQNVKVNPIPEAVVVGDDIKCINSGQSQITFSGSNGFKPYTFTYRINSQPNEIIQTVGLDTFTHVNALNNNVGNFSYYLLSVKDSNNCTNNMVNDTVKVTVNPLPIASMSTPDIVCVGTNADIVFVGSNGSSNYTFNYTRDGVPSNVTGADTAKVTVSSATPGNSIYVLTSVTDANSCTTSYNDAKVVRVSSLPLGTLASTGDITPCVGDNSTGIELKGAFGIKPYTFTYSRKRNSDQPLNFISTTGNADSIFSINVPTTLPDTLLYELLQIKDSAGCLSLPSSSNLAAIYVKPLPTVTISGQDTICVGGVNPKIMFTPSGGTSPYTINYNRIPGGLTSMTLFGTDTTLFVNNTVAGNYVYNLTTVQDANGCAQTAAGSASAKVNPLPSASTTVIGSGTVCKGGAEPIIVLNGASATKPFTFTYTINGGNNINITTASGTNSSNVNCATDTSGVFIYNLVNVRDSNLCSLSLDIKDTIVVNRKPEMELTVSTPSICENTGSPRILLTGSKGKAPYHFYYRDQFLPKDIFSGIYDTISITVTPNHGIYYFIKDSVVDANQCRSESTNSEAVSLNINKAPVKPEFTVGSSDQIMKGLDTISLCKGSSNINFNVFNVIDTLNYSWKSIQPNGVNIQSAASAYASLSFFESGIRTIWVTARTDSNCLDSVKVVVNVNEADSIKERKIILKQPGNLLIYPDNSMDPSRLDSNQKLFHGYQWGRDTILNPLSQPKQLGKSTIISGQTLPVFIPDSMFLTQNKANLDTTKYAFWVLLNRNGCSTKVYYNGPYANKGIPIAELEPEDASISVYPNPTNGELNLNVQGDIYGKLSINLINSLGQSVYHTEVLKKYPEAIFPLNLRDLPPGMYVMQLTGSDQQQFMVKIIIQH